MLIGFTGTMGSGKTMSVSLFGVLISGLCKMGLFSNYASLKDAQLVSSFNDMLKMENGVFCFDETAVSGLDSRQDLRRGITMTHWLVQTRKVGLLVLYTCQDPSMVDKRVRQNTDFMVYCQKVRNNLKTDFDMWQTWVDWPRGKVLRKFLIKDISRFFNLYDHTERVAVIETPASFRFKRVSKVSGGVSKV